MGDKNKNLISLGDRTPEERAAICSAGGKAASENRARRKAFREELIDALAIIEDEKLGKTAQSVGIAAIMQRFKRGDLKAFELIRDTVGEKPTENVNMNASITSPYDDLTADQLRELLLKHERGEI